MAERHPARQPGRHRRGERRGGRPTGWCSTGGRARRGCRSPRPRSPTRWTALALGFVAAGVAPGRPGRADGQDPLRVDAGRLRDLGRGRGDRAGLRDVLGRAGAVDPRPTPAPSACVVETAGARRDARRASRDELPDAARRRGRSTTATAAAAWPTRRAAGTTPDRAELDRRRAALTPGRRWPRSSTPPAPPAGRRAACSPTATSSPRCASAIDDAARAVRGRGRARPCCSCRWPTCSAG